LYLEEVRGERITNYDLRPLFPYATIALLFLCAIAKYGTKSFVSLIILCNRVLKLFGWPQRVSLFLIFFFVFFHCITNYMLWSLFSPPNGHTITLQSVVAAYGSTDVDITSQIIWAPFGLYFDTRSSVQIVRYFLSAYIVLFAWRLLSFLTLWPTCKPVFHALQMTIVNKNVIIFVGFIVIFSIVFAMSGLIAFGREDEEHYGTPWGSWMTTFLYLTGEDQARDIINKPLNVFSSYLDLSFLFPFGECPRHPLRFHRAPQPVSFLTPKPSGFYILCSVFGSLVLCNLIVQMLNDVYGDNKDRSERNYWHHTNRYLNTPPPPSSPPPHTHTNRYLAAIELQSCITRSSESWDWVKQARHSLSIDPDSIEQQVASLRLMPYFRANNLKAN